jgi:hypothetical protein
MNRRNLLKSLGVAALGGSAVGPGLMSAADAEQIRIG